MALARLITLLSLLLVATSALNPPCYASESDVHAEVAELMGKLEYLHRRGVDTLDVAKSLNAVIELAETGRIGEARELLEKIKKVVRSLEVEAEGVYARKTALKYGLVASIASIPVLVYLLLPRVYLYLWFKARRKWVVGR